MGFNQTVTVEATVIEELPSLLYRLELGNKSQVLAHGAGSASANAVRNWVRLLPGDRVEIEFAEHDPTRGRIVKKLGGTGLIACADLGQDNESSGVSQEDLR